MREYHPEGVMLLSKFLEGLVQRKAVRGDTASPLPAEEVREVGKLVGFFEGTLSELAFACSLASIEKIKNASSREGVTGAELSQLLDELQERLHDESAEKKFFVLTPHETAFYGKPCAGWEDIIRRFPNVRDDVEEASKCFALSRYAASVFHSVQVIEFGLIELGTFIGVADPQSGWTSVANRLKKIIETSYPNRSDFEKAHFAFVEQVQGTVEALKNAWRNKVSHAHGKLVLLTADFRPEIAEEILFASRAFMRRLADGLPLEPPPAGTV